MGARKYQIYFTDYIEQIILNPVQVTPGKDSRGIVNKQYNLAFPLR